MGRKKVVIIEGKEFKIGALTFDQVDAYLTPIDLEIANPKEKSRALYDHAIEMVCDGLNNGIQGPDEAATNPPIAKEWSVERFRHTCDRVIFNKLNEEIIVFSGLSLGSAEGGDQAAVAQTSTTSAPASSPQLA